MGSGMKAMTPARLGGVVLAVSGCVLLVLFLGQLRSLGELRDEIRSLKAPGVPPRSGKPDETRGLPETLLDREPVDWAEVASQVEGWSSSGWLGSSRELWNGLRRLSFDELRAMREDYLRADLSARQREILERAVFEAMLRQEGQEAAAMDEFFPKLGENPWDHILSWGVRDWVGRDPLAAVAWCEERFGIGWNWSDVEDAARANEIVGSGFYGALEVDRSAATRLLSLVPPERRIGMLRKMEVGFMPGPKQEAWVETVRQVIPEGERGPAIVWPTLNWADGDGSRMDFEETADYLARISATPDERAAVWEQAAREIPLPGADSDPVRSRLETWRGHFPSEDAAMLDALTGTYLASRRGPDFSERLAIALEYHARGGDDAVLLPLLESSEASKDPDATRAAAERLSESPARTRLLEESP